MRMFNLLGETQALTDAKIQEITNALYEYKGRFGHGENKPKEVLDHLLKQAIIQSTLASNRLEGILTSEARGEAVLSGTLSPNTRSENELLGYQKVLKKIHRHYATIEITPQTILALHREMYSFEPVDFAGQYKTDDNVIQEISLDGKKTTRFVPTNHFETSMSLHELCSSYREALRKNPARALLLIPVFILDFLCIHPFKDGNGRISRLLTLLLLYQAGFDVGRYISLERMIEETKEGYYETLHESSKGWHESQNDSLPFAQYLLSVILGCYRTFEDRIQNVENKENKTRRVQLFFEGHLGNATKKEIQEYCPDISLATIELALAKLVKSGYLEKISGGRFASYRKK